QQNAALVEEATAAARAMQDQAAALSQTVSVFRIDGGSDRFTPERSMDAPRRAVFA
ncbi:hypothetical protein H0E82_02865, partial [Luteimonas sp. SJ-16]|nr:hypothetical protein [Luteimonas deserti]